MLKKVLKRKEVELGFIQIPAKSRAELLGSLTVPFETKLNSFPAKIDNQGRIWCSEYLKGKFEIDTEVILTKNEKGYEIKHNQKKKQSITNKVIREESASVSYDLSVDDKEIQTKKLNATWHKVLEGDCIKYLKEGAVDNVHLTFFDPPYLQGKEYRFFDDNQSATEYWNWIKTIIKYTYKRTSDGGAFYFMHREKNAEIILRILRESGWNFQNLIIWKKMTSAVPINCRFSKQYQIIVYAIKGEKPRVFNKVRIDPPPLPWHKYEHKNGVYLTDVWDDIRELTSGYFAGEEPFRDSNGNRMHIQQTPVALLLRIILSSSMPGDVVFDPTAGTGTALVVTKQLSRNSIGIEIDPSNVDLIKKRLATLRAVDDITSHLEYYKHSPNLIKIWPDEQAKSKQQSLL